jgi:hypothetical protein
MQEQMVFWYWVAILANVIMTPETTVPQNEYQFYTA